MGLRCIAVYVDADAGAPFVQDADEAVRLERGYLDGAAVIAAATRTGAEAIHPGYGFLSENAAFAEDVVAAGLVWVGPSAEVIWPWATSWRPSGPRRMRACPRCRPSRTRPVPTRSATRSS
jgi:acetyl/propionyl-CoA carboxylase alpha subunit